jgi:DNA repair exonuclease SbcCD nuclease subunit
MVKFLHLGDIHLGYRQYKLIEREKDYFHAFLDICVKAIEKQVDFVLVAGDLFNYRSISPQTFNEAVYVFNRLKESKIPVIAIEGNHDFKEIGHFSNSRGSWYEALAQNNLIHFLYQKPSEEGLNPLKLNEKYLGGGYLDLSIKGKIVRIIGSTWQGFNAGESLKQYKELIQKVSSRADFNIFMFHGGTENFLPVNRGGVSLSDFAHLEGVADYIALGHIHEFYTSRNSQNKDWIFNPGSTEANAISECELKRGGLLVEVDELKNISYELIQNHKQRKFIRFDLERVKANDNPEEFLQKAEERVKARLHEYKEDKPLILLNFEGYGKFPEIGSKLNVLRDSIQGAGALYCIVKWSVKATESESIRVSKGKLPKEEFERSLMEQVSAEMFPEFDGQRAARVMYEIKKVLTENPTESQEVISLIEELSTKTI